MRSFIRFLALWIGLLMLGNSAEASRLVRVGVYQNPPGVAITEQGKVQGFYIDILEEAASAEGWQLQYVPGNWADNLARLESAEIDLLVAIAHTQERSKKYQFTRETVFSNWGQVYTRNSEIQSILHLEKRKVAGMRNDIYTIRFVELMNSFNIPFTLVETDEYRDIFKQIADGSVEAGVISRANAKAMESDYDLFRSPIVCCPMEIRYATLKGRNSDILEGLDKEIGVMRKEKDSLYYRSLERWFGGENKREFPGWLMWALAIITGAAILLAVGLFILRRQARLIEMKLEQSYADKREMEVKMLAASKLATIGEVATGVAHELNQPLTYISTFTQNMEVALQNNSLDLERIKKRIGTVNEQFRRIDEIIRHLQTFGRKDETIGGNSMQSIHLSEVVNKTLLFLGERIRLRNITLEKNFADDVPAIAGNMTRLEQIFINFFQNAIHALANRDEATITITIKYLPENQKVQVQFTDNGMGMEPEVRKKIFEPFFTTKGIGEGTGLGLSIVYGIVQEHGGSITCISEPGIGTTFALLFPAKIEP
ncbi:ATP-binding protein [Candidatus Magnetaquicoccus inordinatus]|uniref:ATP-binding protein n=1 Tax=Candidatus Magnetaquicoccus inordinatus TaxID=2496818 RepID=UPI00187D3066|nr:ATP-binding protein [Candidatus Magnetaquicoccus inordinatus]